MSIAVVLLNAGLSFLALFLIFRPLEISYPAIKAQRFFRPHWWTDFCFFAGQYLFLNGAVFWLLGFAQRWIHTATPRMIQTFFAGLRGWEQAVLVILLGDFLIY